MPRLDLGILSGGTEEDVRIKSGHDEWGNGGVQAAKRYLCVCRGN